jgi:hypothetical protein
MTVRVPATCGDPVDWGICWDIKHRNVGWVTFTDRTGQRRTIPWFSKAGYKRVERTFDREDRACLRAAR